MSDEKVWPPPLPEIGDERHFWNLDLLLAGFIAKAVREFAEHEDGLPSGLSSEEWSDVLRRIADGFQRYYDADASVGTRPPTEALDLLKQWFGALWT